MKIMTLWTGFLIIKDKKSPPPIRRRAEGQK
jgi:hypothetical protein